MQSPSNYTTQGVLYPACYQCQNSICATIFNAHLPKNVTKVFECAVRGSEFVLRIGGIESAPMMHKGPTGKLRGLVVDMIRYLTRVMKLSYIFFECDDPQMGFWNGAEWTGCLGMIQRKEIDLFLMPAAPSPQRMEISIPTAPLVNADLIMMSGEPEKVSVNSLAALNHFQNHVWMSFVAAFIIVTSLSLISERFWRKRTRKARLNSMRMMPINKKAEAYNVSRTIFAFFGTLAFQSVPFSNPDDSWRILLATWTFSMMVLMNLFSGQLTAAMTISNEYIKMDSLADVLKFKNLKPIIMARTSFAYFFKYGDPGSEPRLIFEQAERLGGLVPLRIHANPNHIAEMLNRKAVIIGPPFALKSKIGRVCKPGTVHFSREHYFERMMTMSLRFGLPNWIGEEINYRMHRYMDAGHVLKFVRDMELNASKCSWSEPKNDHERVLSIDNVTGPFVLWCFGISTSIIAFISEMFIGEFIPCSRREYRTRYTARIVVPISSSAASSTCSGITSKRRKRKQNFTANLNSRQIRSESLARDLKSDN